MGKAKGPFPWLADWKETGKFLRGFRAWSGQDLEKNVSPRFDELLKTHKENEDWSELRNRVTGLGTVEPENQPFEFLKWLEKEDNGAETRKLSRNEICQLAAAYDVPTLMLDPLFSSTCSENCLLVSINDFVNATQKERNEYGKNVEYHIPQCKLTTLNDHSFGKVCLDPGGETKYHDHPGTELIFNIGETEVELRLETSGVRVPIKPKEFAHFRAEIPHSICNPNQEIANVFVIRCYQLRGEDLRTRVSEIVGSAVDVLDKFERQVAEIKKFANSDSGNLDLDKLKKKVHSLKKDHRQGKEKPYLLLDVLTNVLTSRISSHELEKMRQAPLDKVADLFGLAELLKSIKGDSKLENFFTKDSTFKRTALHDILHASIPLDLKGLLKLAKQFDVQPMILYPFMYPTEPDIVSVRLKHLAKVPLDHTNGVSYHIPYYRLALSGLDIAVVKLQKGEKTHPNQHPGYELIYPLDDAQLTVKIEGGKEYHVSGSKSEYAHFSSVQTHVVENNSEKPAKFFLVRMFS